MTRGPLRQELLTTCWSTFKQDFLPLSLFHSVPFLLFTLVENSWDSNPENENPPPFMIHLPLRIKCHQFARVLSFLSSYSCSHWWKLLQIGWSTTDLFAVWMTLMFLENENPIFSGSNRIWLGNHWLYWAL